jgi:hypothetical protein
MVQLEFSGALAAARIASLKAAIARVAGTSCEIPDALEFCAANLAFKDAQN